MQRKDAIEWLRDNLTAWPGATAPAQVPPGGWSWGLTKTRDGGGEKAFYQPQGREEPITEADVLADGGAFICGQYVRPGQRGKFKTASGYEGEGVYAGRYSGQVWFTGCAGVPADVVADLDQITGWARPDPREEFVRRAREAVPTATAMAVAVPLRGAELLDAIASDLYDAGARFPGQEA